jgi:hypothetical protein
VFKIVQITEANDRIELVSEVSWNDALMMPISLCAEDRVGRYEILDAGGEIVFESYNRSDRRTRGFVLTSANSFLASPSFSPRPGDHGPLKNLR